MIAKIIAGTAGTLILVSACLLDSMSNAPIGIFAAGLALLAAALVADPEVFR